MGKGKRVQSKSKLNIKKIGIILAIILGIIFVFHIANNYIILDKNKKFNLVINNKNITANMKNDILIENDVIYISQPDIKNFFDKYIYEDMTIEYLTIPAQHDFYCFNCGWSGRK